MGGVHLSNTPVAAVTADAPAVARHLSRAFVDDPMMRWFFPSDETRPERLERYFGTLFTRQYGLHGRCERTDAAAAFWVPPEGAEKAVPDEETVRLLREILGDRAELFGEAVAAAAAHAPQEPHWYLAVVGADPAARGRGHGSALLRSGLAEADRAGLPVYLESSKPDNLPLYEHFGFVVREELRLPGGGPALWAMRRAPR
ncbi:GNAT family N-acetyltransferase [Streptomyces sp. NPDC097619]|uniref:GNAT family N-acetyltransferase n=1 Tax=Streptomyces sp. NPDC097619 TaxID=3157228 RepID=UPI00331B45A0